MFGRRKIAALVAEFLGTGVLTMLILTVQRSTIGVPFFVAAAAGLAILLMSFTLGDASGGYFNPAITIGLWTARKVSTLTGVLYIAMQFLGAWAAYGVYTYFVNTTLQPIGGHFTGRILVGEAIGAGIFAFGFAATVYNKYSRPVIASFVGLSLMLGVLAASPAAIGLLNPAVALGVRAWVWGTYVLGPVLGAIIGINLYGILYADTKDQAGVAAIASVFSSSSVTTTAKPATKPAAKKKTTTRKKK